MMEDLYKYLKWTNDQQLILLVNVSGVQDA